MAAVQPVFEEHEGGGIQGDDVRGIDDGIQGEFSILGVIILAMSLAFFYLYLAFVYPISEIV